MIRLDNLDKLRDYSPEDAMFTTKAEMDYIHNTLGLDDATDDELNKIRNMCVKMWGERIRLTIDKERFDEYNDLNSAMQSITAVIDREKYKRGIAI